MNNININIGVCEDFVDEIKKLVTTVVSSNSEIKTMASEINKHLRLAAERTRTQTGSLSI